MIKDEIALLLDPARERGGWWRRIIQCPAGHEIDNVVNIASDAYYICRYCDMGFGPTMVSKGPWACTAPDFATDDLAAFRWLVPVLRKAGCDIWMHEKRTSVVKGIDAIAVTEWPVIACTKDYQCKKHFSKTCVAAIAHLAHHEPETCARAVQEVRGWQVANTTLGADWR